VDLGGEQGENLPTHEVVVDDPERGMGRGNHVTKVTAATTWRKVQVFVESR
jgi:hypothetical protein